MPQQLKPLKFAACLLGAALTLAGAASPSLASEPSGCTRLGAVSPTAGVDFETQIQPVFDSRCIDCHQEGGSGDLNLVSGAAWETLVGQVSSRSPDQLLVEPFRPDQSVLFHSVNCDDPGGPFFRMGDLSLEQQGLVRDWIAQGAHPEPFSPEIPAEVRLQEVFPSGTFGGALGLTHAGDGSNRLLVVRQGGLIEVFEAGGSRG